MKALVVGLGSIGRRHARNWAALGLGEVWVCRTRQARQPEPPDVDARYFSDLGEALAAKPDVVLVTNPTSLHVETASAAVRAGIPTFVEKPIGSSLEGLEALLAASEACAVPLMVGYHLRFHPGLQRLRELLKAGAIGRPLTARAEVGEYLPAWHPWEDYRQGYSARRDLGGGPVLTLSHELDALCWVLGQPTLVSCLAAHVSDLVVDTEDVAEIALRFANRVLGSVHVDYLRRPTRRYLEVTGEEGTLRWEYEENRLLVYAAGASAWRVEQGRPDFDRNDLFLDEMRHVAACVAGTEQPLVDGRQGAAVLAVALAALRSSGEGRQIYLNEHELGEGAKWLTSLGRR